MKIEEKKYRILKNYIKMYFNNKEKHKKAVIYFELKTKYFYSKIITVICFYVVKTVCCIFCFEYIKKN